MERFLLPIFRTARFGFSAHMREQPIKPLLLCQTADRSKKQLKRRRRRLDHIIVIIQKLLDGHK